MDNEKKNIKVGIIGCGKIAASKHMPGLARLENVELRAFQNRTRSKAVTAAERFGSPDARVYDTYRDLLRDGELEAVHICTSNDSHAEIAIAALEAGLHVMCEKPMALNANDARRMVEAAETNGKKLSVSYQNRFRGDSRELKKLCLEGGLGEIYHARAHALRRRGIPTWGDFLDREKQGGGALIDIGTHALDLTLWLMDNNSPRMVVGKTYNYFGKKEHISARLTPESSREYDIDDSAFAFIQMQNGATIILESSWALNTLEIGEARASLYGTLAGADMKDGLRINGAADGSLYERKIAAAEEEAPGFLEMAAWIDSLREGREPVVRAREALVVAEILDAVYKSSETGEAVYF